MADEGDLIADRYRLAARIGQGAMGVVWHAHDERLRRTVAVKQISRISRSDDRGEDVEQQSIDRVLREGRLAARLQHPHAIVVYDVVEHDDRPWLVMEYLASRSLAEVLVADGALGVDEVARVGRQVAAALTAAHDAGIVHRDVKPANVLLDMDGLVKVTDFGISRAVDEVTVTSTGTFAGTPAYLAPEVARGHRADFRSDVYSVGATLYTALEGTPPYGTQDNALALLHQVASGDFVPPRQAGALTPLLLRLLDPEPDRRPQMEQVRDELARAVSVAAGTEAGPPTPVFPRPALPDPAPHPMRPAPPRDRTTEALPARAPTGAAGTLHVPAGPSEEPDDRTPGRVRRRAPWLAAAAVVLLALGGLTAFLLGTGGGATSATSAPGTGGTSSAPPGGSGSGSAPAGTAPGGDTGSAGATPSASPQERAVTDYYGLVPERLDEGWERLTPTYQQGTAGGFDGYRRFWSAFERVEIVDVSSPSEDTVQATLTYVYPGGRTSREETTVRLVPGDGGWKIDDSSVGGS